MIHVPSLAQRDRAAGPRIWLCTGPTDMRRAFDRLAEQARRMTRQDPRAGRLFIFFRSRGGDRLRLPHWDNDGYYHNARNRQGAKSAKSAKPVESSGLAAPGC